MRYKVSNLIKPTLLNEISQKEVNDLKNFFSKNDIENPYFSDLFGGKQRIIIPFTRGGLTGEIGEIINFFYSQGFDVDLKNGVVKKEIEYEIPKGEKKGEIIKKTFNERIGKVLKLFEEIFELHQTEKNASAITSKLKKLMPDIYKKQELFDLVFAETTESPGRAVKWSKWWATKSEFYRRNPEAIEKDTKYSIILSIAPIDVLRMSDWRHLYSCHQEGNSHFHCARSEARSSGGIAYLVKNEDIKNIDLNEEEIFEDKKRGIDGITPIARVRLRNFKDKKGKFNLT